jgi:pyruvate dehydrogenase E1 component alpha subunit
MHLIDLDVNFMGTSAIVGNSIPIGVGVALKNKINNEKRNTYIFFGDGAVEEGVFFESINFAVLKNLPAIFICENNLYSVYSPFKVRQPKNRKIFKLAQSLGIKSFVCKKNSLLDVWSVLRKVINYVNKRKKPVFIEFETYRWLEHCGPNYDDQLNYRSEKILQKNIKNDSLKKLRNILRKKYSILKIEMLEKKVFDEINQAFKFAEKSNFPKKNESKNHIYAKK